jgi:tRNA pseudouridine55 synthase
VLVAWVEEGLAEGCSLRNSDWKRSASGLLNLDKPSGITSRAVVDLVARPLRGIKVGHAGTLDPLAAGVLVVCVGRATRLIEYVQQMKKTYRTVILLGASSDTLDADGVIVQREACRVPEPAEVAAALATQVGTILQRPPEFSALKRGGRRAYDLARAGEPVELEPRPVTIERIDLVSYAWPRLELEIVCGSGTYIRSIARDVGDALGCGGLVEVLVRTRIGPFTREEALETAGLTDEAIATGLRPALDAVPGLPRLALSPQQVADAVQGRAVQPCLGAEQPLPEGEIALIGPGGELVAIAEREAAGTRLLPRRVLATGSPGSPAPGGELTEPNRPGERT